MIEEEGTLGASFNSSFLVLSKSRESESQHHKLK